MNNDILESMLKPKEKYTFDNYGWTEHISRKEGQWLESPDDLLEQLEACVFNIRYSTREED